MDFNQPYEGCSLAHSHSASRSLSGTKGWNRTNFHGSSNRRYDHISYLGILEDQIGFEPMTPFREQIKSLVSSTSRPLIQYLVAPARFELTSPTPIAYACRRFSTENVSKNLPLLPLIFSHSPF